MTSYDDLYFDAKTEITRPIKNLKRGQRWAKNKDIKKARMAWRRISSMSHHLQEREAARSVNTPKPCSCWMCGNFRKHYGKPIRELREPSAEEYFE